MLYLQKAKSLIEKKRRARINACLEELKAIVTERNADVSFFGYVFEYRFGKVI